MNVIELLDETCARAPSATALMWGLPSRGGSLTFAELGERSRRLASLFRRTGLCPGDALVIFVPPSGPLYEVMAGALRLGLIAVFVEPTRWRQTLEEAVARLPVRGFVGTPVGCAARWLVPQLRGIAHAFVTTAAFPGAISLHEAAHCTARAGVEPCSDEATALLTFTSGSTGRPKGVLRSHGTLLATHRALSRHLALGTAGISLATLPFIAFANLAAGTGTVIPDLNVRRPAKTDSQKLLRQLREWNVSSLVATPFLARCIAENCRNDGATLEALQHVFTGGAPVLPELLDKLSAAAPRARIGAIYGATEAEPIATANLPDFGREERARIGSGGGVLVGRPVEGIKVRIIGDTWGAARGPFTDVDFDREILRDGACGEIVVSGPNVSPGYLGGVGDRDNKIMVNATVWHRTGDAGYFDPAGRLWLAGRCAARIVRNNHTCYPLQAEAALDGVQNTRRATLIQDGHGRTVLLVQPAGRPGDVSTDEILSRIAWCRPDEILMVDEIPLDRRHHAKVSYAEVLRLLERGKWLARTVVPPDSVPLAPLDRTGVAAPEQRAALKR